MGDPGLHAELARLRASHQWRAALLRERVAEYGGCVVAATESWGAFANAFHRVQGARDDAMTLDALREGEAWGLADYETDLPGVDPGVHSEIAAAVLEEQRETWARVLRLVAARRA